MLQPEIPKLNYGYDPALSEGAVKSPVFLTQAFIFNRANDGRDFSIMFPAAARRQADWSIPALLIPTAKSLRTGWRWKRRSRTAGTDAS